MTTDIQDKKINITRWFPDTCACALEYSWKAGSSEDERVHTPHKVVDTCPHAEDNHSAFIVAQGGDLGAIKFEVESWDNIPGFDFKKLNSNGIKLGDGIGGITLPITEQNLTDGLEYVAVFSDGVTQIEGQDWKDAVVQLLAFKGVAGEFAKRRMIRHIKDSQKAGKGPMDDIGYAVIRVENEVQHAAQ